MIEFRNVADRLPPGERVTVLAGDGQRSVGTTRTLRIARVVLWRRL